jgi:predicted RNA-binding protein
MGDLRAPRNTGVSVSVTDLPWPCKRQEGGLKEDLPFPCFLGMEGKRRTRWRRKVGHRAREDKGMCQMRVVMEKNGAQEPVMDGVARLEAGPDGVTVSALFEEPRLVPGARVKTIDFLGGLLTLEPMAKGGQ